MSAPIIAVVGSVNMDLAVATPRVPLRGENLLAHGLHVGLGGKGANPAVACARMGASVQLIGCVGEDAFGRQAKEGLAAEGVGLAGLSTAAVAPTGVALIMVDDGGENTILVAIGANDALTPAAVERGLAALVPPPTAILVNFEIPAACVAATVRYGTRHQIPVIVDAGPPRPLGPEVWGGARVLSPNAQEAESLVGYPVTDNDAAIRAARELRAAGPQAVVLKRGALGALVCARDGITMVPGFRVRVVDTTGAGDAFTAAFTLGIAEGQSLTDAARFGCAAGALAVTRMGTMGAMPTRREIEQLLAR